MTDRDACEAAFLANLDWIRRAMAAVCRRHRMDADDADDFASWATLRLIADDYAVLRRFRGESALRTYLVVVIATLHREYRCRAWGRWRPSAAARRAGPLAVALETLVHRDGHPPRLAVERLRASGRTALADAELAALLARLPRRLPRPVRAGPAALADVADPATADDLVTTGERDAERRALRAALRAALDALSAEDRAIVRLRYWRGMSVADVARALSLPQKPLYRRLERSLTTLRRALATAAAPDRRARPVDRAG